MEIQKLVLMVIVVAVVITAISLGDLQKRQDPVFAGVQISGGTVAVLPVFPSVRPTVS